MVETISCPRVAPVDLWCLCLATGLCLSLSRLVDVSRRSGPPWGAREIGGGVNAVGRRADVINHAGLTW